VLVLQRQARSRFRRTLSLQVSTLASTPTLSYLAIGLVSGQVLIYRHLQQSLTSSPTAVSSFPKARVLWEGTAAEPITGLGFRFQARSHSIRPHEKLLDLTKTEASGRSDSSASVGIFIVTTHKTISVPIISGKGSEPRVIEDAGAALNCSVMDCDQQMLVVGREDGIYTYDTEGRGACFAYEGQSAR
jgi:hypothetical protein